MPLKWSAIKKYPIIANYKQRWPSLCLIMFLLLFAAYFMSSQADSDETNLRLVQSMRWVQSKGNPLPCGDDMVPGNFYELSYGQGSFEFYYSLEQNLFASENSSSLFAHFDANSILTCTKITYPSDIEEL